MTVAPERRRYDNARRRQWADETRDRIVTAGCEILESSPVRDWRPLTIRAVAERAGVNERTVYRHLVNERGLRDAVMQRLEAQAGIDLDTLELDDIGDVAARIIASISSHPPGPRPTLDPTLTATSQRQHEALLRALTPATLDWSDRDRAIAAAMLDALWGVAVYERLAVDWELDRQDTTRAITWVIGLIQAAIREDRRPEEPG